MKYNVKSLNYPSYIGIFFFFGLGFLIFLFLFVSYLCYLFFWLVLPWILFWAYVSPKYIAFDKVKILDKGIIITHSKKNWLTTRIKDVAIPWEHLSQIRAIIVGGGKPYYSHYFVLDDRKLLSVPASVERGVEGDNINDIAEAYASFLKSKLGQKVSVYKAAKYSQTTILRKKEISYKPANYNLTSCIVVSRIDTINEISKNIRKSQIRLILTYNGFFIIGIILTVLMIYYTALDSEIPHPAELAVIALFLGLGLLPLRHKDKKLIQRYLDYVRKKQNEMETKD